MFERILYPTDFSDVSMKALEYIKRLAQAGTREVVVLHVIDQRTRDVLQQNAPMLAEHYEQVARDDIRADLTRTIAELQAAGLHVRGIIRLGIPLLEILRAEREEEISAIVLGSHGKSNLQEVLLGSVSEKVMRRCAGPVLVIKR